MNQKENNQNDLIDTIFDNFIKKIIIEIENIRRIAKEKVEIMKSKTKEFVDKLTEKFNEAFDLGPVKESLVAFANEKLK